MTDTRYIRTVAEWEAFCVSRHRRDHHQPALALIRDCPWCDRWARLEAVFHGELAAPEPSDLTLWTVAG